MKRKQGLCWAHILRTYGGAYVAFHFRNLDGGVVVLDLDGELDRHLGVRELHSAVASIKPNSATRLVMNFKSVSYICSEAVGLICMLAEEVRKAGGCAACCSVVGLPKDVFEILGVTKILAMHDTEAAACSAVMSGRSKKS